MKAEFITAIAASIPLILPTPVITASASPVSLSDFDNFSLYPLNFSGSTLLISINLSLKLSSSTIRFNLVLAFILKW
ncbi:hypothetical protein D3C76_1245370 [compost metagenome]